LAGIKGGVTGPKGVVLLLLTASVRVVQEGKGPTFIAGVPFHRGNRKGLPATG
jgi:hypothetical protein